MPGIEGVECEDYDDGDAGVGRHGATWRHGPDEAICSEAAIVTVCGTPKRRAFARRTAEGGCPHIR
jgi:hypothetical protein